MIRREGDAVIDDMNPRIYMLVCPACDGYIDPNDPDQVEVDGRTFCLDCDPRPPEERE